VTGLGPGRLANGTLRTIVRLECANGKSLITEYPLTYHVENDTLVDLDGVAWSRIEAAEE
jgi:hypothetical protein